VRIKRVEVIGFKSFCDRAVINVDAQVIAVVGPNGCGKSNIVDAIRWCMGEQSAKHLRGKSMEDVIFAGSESRGPAPMAEVSLTFDDVGFSHETLEMALKSDEAEAARALEALDDGTEPGEPGEPIEPGVASEPALADAAAPATGAEGTPAPDAVVGPAAADGDAATPMAMTEAGADGGFAAAAAAVTVLDENGQPIVSASADVRDFLSDQADRIDFSRYTEVTITRRLFRDGTSQYFINKTPCRLRDITDFFLGTGVGTKAYSIIEQGRIGQIVSARPGDRRAIIEEAAGITKFKSKKKAAERKLEQTKQNLLRVSDIVAELDKRMGTLRRQAQKAERYRKYKAEMRDLELCKASHRFLELRNDEYLAGGRLHQAREELDGARTEWSIKDAHLVAERAELSIEERRLAALQETVYELDNRIRLAESKIGFETREGDELATRSATALAEAEELAETIATTQAELDARAAELTELADASSRAGGEAASAEAAAREIRAEVDAAQRALDDARAQLAASRGELAAAEGRTGELTRRREEGERRLARVGEDVETTRERSRELERELRRVDGQLTSARQTRLDLGNQRENFTARAELLTDDVARREAQVETLRTELHRRKSRLQSLLELQERYEGFARGTRAVMQREGALADCATSIHGLVADVVRAPETLEVAVEAALGDRLGGVLVDGADIGARAISYLKHAGAGRSTFVAVPKPWAAKAAAPSAWTPVAAPAAVAMAAAPAEAAPEAQAEAAPALSTITRTWVTAPRVVARAGEPAAEAAADAALAAEWIETEVVTEVLAEAPASAAATTTVDDAPAASAASSDDGDDRVGSPIAAALAAAATPAGASAWKIEVDDRTALTAAAAAIGGAGVVGRLTDLLEFADGYDGVGRTLLGQHVVVDSLDRAIELHQQGLSETLVTLDGDVVDPSGVVSGGSREAKGAGVLAQKREIRELEEIVGVLEHDLAEASAELITARTELKQVTKAIEGLRGQVHQGELEIMGHEKDSGRLRGEHDRLRERLDQLGTEHIELTERLATIASDEDTLRQRREAAAQRIDDLERGQLGMIEQVTGGRDRLEAANAALTTARVAAAQAGEKRASADAAVLRLGQTLREVTARAERLREGSAIDLARSTELREACAALAEEVAELRARRLTEATALDEGRSGYEGRLTELTVVELAARELRGRADRLAGEVGQLELRLSQIAMNRQVLLESVAERHQVDVPAILHDFHLRPITGAAEDARLAELRDLIERMGTDINLTAIDEFAEVSQRHEFLSGQQADLEDAVGQLDRAIDKINKTSRRLFKETFHAVNDTFKKVFPRLFRGGQATLSLTGGDDVDLLEAGVEIMAQPPGKKNSTVDQLSGGEKALTAVAMIFSIFLIKPSPFCILDEVDAPLDEANVDRYNEIVREMTDRSQFIVISHNKRTMESADRLYGVTMKEPGVSMLVSVNLSKVGKTAA
jgi:chromosome segregation protein